jgi:hypothetical protein
VHAGRVGPKLHLDEMHFDAKLVQAAYAEDPDVPTLLYGDEVADFDA